MGPSPVPSAHRATCDSSRFSSLQPAAGGGQRQARGQGKQQQQVQYTRRQVSASSSAASGSSGSSGTHPSGSEDWGSHDTDECERGGEQEQVVSTRYTWRCGRSGSDAVVGVGRAAGKERAENEGLILALGCVDAGGAGNGTGVQVQSRGRGGSAARGRKRKSAAKTTWGRGKKARSASKKRRSRAGSSNGSDGGEEDEDAVSEEDGEMDEGGGTQEAEHEERDAGGEDDGESGEEDGTQEEGEEESEGDEEDREGDEEDKEGDEDNEKAVAQVKRMLKLYSLFNRRAIKTEDDRVTKERRRLGLIGPNDEPIPKSKLKGKAKNVRVPSKRPDLVALKVMLEKGLLQKTRTVGAIAGVRVGDRFFARAEMVVVGLHRHWLNGIDIIPQAESPYDKSIAVAVVVSGGYEDDEDEASRIWYTGQGGNDLLGSRKQVANQVLRSGNLALMNSIKVKNDVRVIRGHNCKKSDTGRAFTYDGLYKVKQHQYVRGEQGFFVYKFLLVRNPGQPPLTTDQVRFMRGQIPTSVNRASDVVCADLSNGKERLPVPVTNCIDTPPTMPPAFEYVTERIMPTGLKLHGGAHKCECKGACRSESKCACAKRNRDGFPYVQGGRLVKARGIVLECGSACGCGPACNNRVGQQGLRFRLEVYKTAHKGWAVRSWDFIPAGAVVCEYVGDVLPYERLNHVEDDMYVISIDTVRTAKLGTQGRDPMFEDLEHALEEQAKAKPSAKKKHRATGKASKEGGEGGEGREHEEVHYAIDGLRRGNVARFINHSCSPNLFYQSALWDHKRPELSHLLLVASENIPPLTFICPLSTLSLPKSICPLSTLSLPKFICPLSTLSLPKFICPLSTLSLPKFLPGITSSFAQTSALARMVSCFVHPDCKGCLTTNVPWRLELATSFELAM
ncbi:unnamed protein product [Closterium sp. NIES-65]|nr:unnamed protein product [Closterium sp. NIES-65]